MTGFAADVQEFAFSEENEAEAKKIIARYPEGRQASAVLPLLHLAQAQHGGWLPRAILDYVAGYLGMPPIRVYEVASFYDMFNTRRTGRVQIRACTTTPCWLAGSDAVVRACKDVLGVGIGASTEDGRFYLREFECLGACANAPILWVDDDFYEDLDYDRAKAVLEALVRGEHPTPGSQAGRTASMPKGGKTTLHLDPHRDRTAREGDREEGRGEPAEDMERKGRPEDDVQEHHETTEAEGRPAEGIGEDAAGPDGAKASADAMAPASDDSAPPAKRRSRSKKKTEGGEDA
jgi:NADH-quinone oxidoreductase E subunit